MVTGIDVGNSTVSFCSFHEKTKVFHKETLPLHQFNINEISSQLMETNHCILSSVVKKQTLEIQDYCKRNSIHLHLIQKQNTTLIDFSQYKTEIGADRICSSVGAAFEYAPPVLIVDMGTATTFSLIDSNFVYQGGLITPGVSTLFKSLKLLTDQLPELKLEEKPSGFFGFDTNTNIKNGIYYLVLNGIQGIVNKIKENYPEIKVIGTGGWSNFFKEIYDFVDQDLIFKGLQKLFYKQKREAV